MSRIVIYQLFVRHFSNTNTQGVFDGTLEQNGCGKFNEITEKALSELVNMGVTHLWLTGVLDHENSDPALRKGKAGSPYAIRDYYSVCADYAVNPEFRLAEFSLLVRRAQLLGLKVLIDFVPNHVARSYQSKANPESNFGANDCKEVFFARDNHFYYLEGEGELTLPVADSVVYSPESQFGRVTGNNVASWSPTQNDWYETVKLNYGFDYRKGEGLDSLPQSNANWDEVPDTWRRMYEILEFWALLGIDGVRVDMAHMVPVSFWRWVIARLRRRHSSFYFMAEAYATDPASVLPNQNLQDLTDAGFDSYYDQELYHTVKDVVEEAHPISSLDQFIFEQASFQNGVRYIENHDEVRVANSNHWGTACQNLAASALMMLLGRGPVMLYNGQEVGEQAEGAEGFSRNDGRTSIFDYTSLPTLQKWTNAGKYDGGGLDSGERAIRESYARLLRVSRSEAFSRGKLYGLNYANPHLTERGVFVFLRSIAGLYGESRLVVCDLSKAQNTSLSISIPEAALLYIGLSGRRLCLISDQDREVNVLTNRKKGGVECELIMNEHWREMRIIPISTSSL